MIWNYVIAFVGGALLTLVVLARLTSGVLQVFIPNNPFSEESAYLGVQLGKACETIHNKKYVIFKVEVKKIDSQN